MMILPREFYSRDTVMVARDLLGKILVRDTGSEILSGIIIETEAYGHSDDTASHAHRRMTDRNRAMFGEVGRAYVYFTYGMHYCFNAVARASDQAAGAVLIRAISPHVGEDIMKINRGRDRDIANGPAKLAQAMSITTKQYGTDLTISGPLYIKDASRHDSVITGPRVGVTDTREWNYRVS